jgi:hypothetical protein
VFEEGVSFIPGHVGGFFNHIISIESGDGDEFNDISFVSDFF